MKNKKIKIAINGFGRIGRLLFREICGDKRYDIVAINDLSDINNLAYLLKYDTIYRTYAGEVKAKQKNGSNYLEVAGDEVLVISEPDPEKLPWKKLDVDIAVEATGRFESYEKASVHLKAGAKKVVLTAPPKDEERSDAKTVLIGINENQFKTCNITSNGSCTTNSVHPVMAIMSETIGVKKAMLSTIHGYTATQSLVDSISKGKDMRRGRAAAMNIIPSSTGASISVAKVVNGLKGKFDGIALRVPTITGSVSDITFLAGRSTTVKEVNDIFRKAAKEKRWEGVLAVTDDQLVSSDVIGMPYGAIIDMEYTRVIDGDLVKVLSWYDNEMGYIATLSKHIEKAAESL